MTLGAANSCLQVEHEHLCGQWAHGMLAHSAVHWLHQSRAHSLGHVQR